MNGFLTENMSCLPLSAESWRWSVSLVISTNDQLWKQEILSFFFFSKYLHFLSLISNFIIIFNSDGHTLGYSVYLALSFFAKINAKKRAPVYMNSMYTDLSIWTVEKPGIRLHNSSV